MSPSVKGFTLRMIRYRTLEYQQMSTLVSYERLVCASRTDLGDTFVVMSSEVVRRSAKWLDQVSACPPAAIPPRVTVGCSVNPFPG